MSEYNQNLNSDSQKQNPTQTKTHQNINTTNGPPLPTMLEFNENYPTNPSIKSYISLVSNGKFYEYFQEQVRNKLKMKYVTRKEIKEAVFTVFFTDNRFIGQREAEPKKLFRDLFPDVYEVFRLIKKNNKNRLAIILQRIESYLFLDVICKKISKENPNIPLFTIHDSIATTEEYVDIVDETTYNTLTDYVGYPPKLKREAWF